MREEIHSPIVSNEPNAFETNYAIEIAELVRYDDVQYDRQRKAAADRLGIRPETLDKQVQAARRAVERQSSVNVGGVDLTGFLLNEDGVAQAFTFENKGRLLYDHNERTWLFWDGSIWRRDQTERGFDLAREVCRKAAERLAPDNRLRQQLAKAATATAIVRYARSDREFAVETDVWDRDALLLGSPGGTIDLKTGEVREPDAADRITRMVAVTPAPIGAEHPLWTKFLEEATGGDKELEGFLQRMAGYCLTGKVTEEILCFIYGDGGTGKGTFIGTIVAILGNYCISVPIEVFTAGTRLNLEYYRAKMAGARVVTASETETGATWAESQIKEMTGNETPLSGRHPCGRPFTFMPTFKIVLVGNHAPRLKGRTRAMERRLRIVPFKKKPEKPDHNLKENLREEYPAILRWMIDGCLAWGSGGLASAPAVDAETANYFEQQDAFGRWLDERCMLDRTLSEKPSTLLSDFIGWAKDNNELAATPQDFREMIERTPHLSHKKSNGLRTVQGIGLKPSAQDIDSHRQRYGD